MALLKKRLSGYQQLQKLGGPFQLKLLQTYLSWRVPHRNRTQLANLDTIAARRSQGQPLPAHSLLTQEETGYASPNTAICDGAPTPSTSSPMATTRT
jgi:hypothetical protein